MNERDGAVMDANISDPVAATDPRQDDYDIWLGTVTLDKWIPWNRHGCSNVLYLVQVSHIRVTFRERAGRHFWAGRSLVIQRRDCEFMARTTINPLD
jgi:hypothetical protein